MPDRVRRANGSDLVAAARRERQRRATGDRLSDRMPGSTDDKIRNLEYIVEILRARLRANGLPDGVRDR